MEKDKVYRAAEDEIKKALHTRAAALSLTYMQLTALPESLGQLTQLQTLSVSGNELVALPESLGRLAKLQTLDLKDNQLETLPESLGQLTQLQTLSVSGNELVALPESLGRLAKLQALDIDSNRLQLLPESLGNLTNLKQLRFVDNKLSSLPPCICRLYNLEVLAVWGNCLESIPDRIGDLHNLRKLYLKRNKLVTLPESIGELRKLTDLSVRINHLTSLPESIGGLAKLTMLLLSDNQLESIPESVGKLANLTRLDLDNNKLSSLPESVGNLVKLTELDVKGNQLESIPESVGKLANLKRLNLDNNKLSSLPESVGSLAKLKMFDVDGNKLSSLPRSLGNLKSLTRLRLGDSQLLTLPEAVVNLTNLERLDLDNNKLSTLPETVENLKNLKALHLDGNHLTSLPEALLRLSQLEGLFLHGNEMLGIPPEILGPKWGETREYLSSNKTDQSNPRAILEWYFKSRVELTRRLNEAKMLLVGQGGVGKTSLVHRLIHNKPCNPDELPTEGINIDDWEVQGKKGADGAFERIDLHIWDFGGQEIMHATHQFFLTRRSLYLLVIDARAGEKESNIHYWLKIIQSYGGNSPVLLVVNKCDQHPHELNETRLMQDYPNIRGFFQASCATGQGITKLRREICKHVRRLPHVFDELPASYFKVKAELEWTAQKKNYIPIDAYRDICRRSKVVTPESQNRLIRFLHDLGVVLNFQDPEDPYGQDDQFVLDPEWVTEGVYAILNDAILKQKKDGILTLAGRRRILSNVKPLNERIAKKAKAGECFPAERHGFIMDKMCQFELAYELDRQSGKQAWLIPELLNPTEPSSLDWAPETSLNFRYDYPVLPSGIVCRFIVRMQHYVRRELSWRSGTVLDIKGNQILIRGDTDKSKVHIAVQGPMELRRERLAIVRGAFDYIHSTIPALKPEEKVPLPDMPAVVVSYTHLLKLHRSRQKEHFPEGAERTYSVDELLNGVDSALYRLRRRHNKTKKLSQEGEKHIFVSYCHDNKGEVARIVEELEKAGKLVWWDEYIPGGRDWKEAIREEMKNAYAVVVCLSPELTEKRHCSGVYPELRDAIATFRQYGPGHAYIFPVRLAECKVPPIEIDDTRTLERIQCIDLFPESKRDAGLKKLFESLADATNHSQEQTVR